MRLILVLLLIALQASCRFVGTACEDACLYKKALVFAIASADRIVVSEHSSGWESIKPGSESLEALPQRLYGEVEFDSPSKAWLLDLATAMPDKSQRAFAACVPEYHHTIVFYAHGKPQSTMSICFQCGQVTWDASQDVPPEALLDSLKLVVARAGFRPKRDWDAMASASRRAARVVDAGQGLANLHLRE